MGSLKVFLIAALFLIPNTALAATCQEFDKALETASRIRNLKILAPVNCKVVNKQKFTDLMHETYAENLSQEKLDLEEIASKMTGLIPQGYDYSRCYFVNNLESVVASYFPSHHSVFIPEGSETSFDLLVHEATHALQDQHFDLAKKSKSTSHSTDSSFSFLALAEGDAELVQSQYLKENSNQKRKSSEQYKQAPANSCELPQSLLFQLDFPYFWGARYVSTLPNLDDTFSKYPRFTTQILYPNKSFRYKQPTSNESLKLVKSQFKKEQIDPKPIYEDSWGEYTLRCLLRELIGSRFSVIAGYGWLGDKISMYKFKNKPQEHVLSWIFIMDQEKDVIELFKALKLSLERRFNLKFNTDSNTILFGNDTYSKILLRHENNRVQFLVSDQKL